MEVSGGRQHSLRPSQRDALLGVLLCLSSACALWVLRGRGTRTCVHPQLMPPHLYLLPGIPWPFSWVSAPEHRIQRACRVRVGVAHRGLGNCGS